MPCRREEEEEAGEEEEEEEDSFLLLEQSVTVGGSVEVDRLVAQIGETLQLDAAQDRPASACAPSGPPLQPPRPPAAVRADKARAPAQPLLLPPASVEAGGPAPPGALRCALGDRGRVRGRAAPYFVAELAAGPSALSPLPPQPSLDGPLGADKRGSPQPLSGPCRRGWLRDAAASRRLQHRRGLQPTARNGDDDPHRLLQQLVLSGNLIKEAVRRLHSRRLQLHAKLPQRQFLGPLSAPVHEPPFAPQPSRGLQRPRPVREEGAAQNRRQRSSPWQLTPREWPLREPLPEGQGVPLRAISLLKLVKSHFRKRENTLYEDEESKN